jgi:hypothetical protein
MSSLQAPMIFPSTPMRHALLRFAAARRGNSYLFRTVQVVRPHRVRKVR